MQLLHVMLVLWRLVDRRRRVTAVALVGLIIVAGLLETFGMVAIFVYIEQLSNLSGKADGRLPWIEIQASPQAFAFLGGVALITWFIFKNAVVSGADLILAHFLNSIYVGVACELYSRFLRMRLEALRTVGLSTVALEMRTLIELFQLSFLSSIRIVAEAVTIGLIGAALFWFDSVLAMTMAILFAASGGLMQVLMRAPQRRLGAERLAGTRAAEQTLSEAVSGAVEVRLSGAIHFFISCYGRAVGRIARTMERQQAMTNVPRGVNEVTLAVGVVAAAAYLVGRDGSLGNALATLALFGFAGLRLTTSLSRTSALLAGIEQQKLSFARFTERLEVLAPDLLDWRQASCPRAEDYMAGGEPLPAGTAPRMTQVLKLTDVTFKYPGAENPALDGVSLEIPKGRFVGICGPSGGGKSTLMLVMLALMRPQRGRVLCDGWDVFRHIAAWHANVGYVPQTPFIAAASLRENVAFGVSPAEVDDAAVWRALEGAQLAEFGRTQSHGLDTMLGERGALLSGGERQRVAIARALYRDPEVLFFDEATAALDNVTERELTRRILDLASARTVICIAHRLGTIRSCYEIHYVENGQITASGTYKALLDGCEGFVESLGWRRNEGGHCAPTSRQFCCARRQS